MSPGYVYLEGSTRHPVQIPVLIHSRIMVQVQRPTLGSGAKVRECWTRYHEFCNLTAGQDLSQPQVMF